MDLRVAVRGIGTAGAVGAALLTASLFAAGTASADGAIVIKDSTCGLLDGNGAPTLADLSHAVITPSGNNVLKCSATVTAPASGQAAHFDFTTFASPCETPSGTTNDWMETVSASGQATLTCKVHQ